MTLTETKTHRHRQRQIKRAYQTQYVLYLPKVWGSRIWNIILTVFLWWQRQRQRHNFMHFLRGDYFSGLNFFQGWIYEFRTVYLVKFPSLFSFFCLFVVVAANSESGLTCPSLSGPECTLLNNHNVTYINIYNFSKNRLVTCFFIDCWKQFSCETLEAEIKNSHRLKILVGENFGKTFGWKIFCNMSSSTKYHQIKGSSIWFPQQMIWKFWKYLVFRYSTRKTT